MAGLASALALSGQSVTYVAEQELSAERLAQGWQVLEMPDVRLRFVAQNATVNGLLREAPASAVHLCQGIRANGRVATAQRVIARGHLRHWVVMETVDDAGAAGMMKRWEYARLFRSKGRGLEGVLATGYNTMAWIIERGVSPHAVYPFAYFLPGTSSPLIQPERQPGPFRFLFVGQFIPRKRLDLLIQTLQAFMDRDFCLLVVGTGRQEARLRALAERALPNRVIWLGVQPQAEVRLIMSQADCLVLPSRHDGWGAVVSEAMMAGTPVICSDGCGAAGVVEASGVGGVFPSDSANELETMLDAQLRSGPLGRGGRMALASWATALGAEAGSRYLVSILDYVAEGGLRPVPPWHGRALMRAGRVVKGKQG